MENVGHVNLGSHDDGQGIKIVQLTDLHQWPSGVKTFKARGRVIDFDKEGYDTGRNVELVEHVLQRSKPDLVILTGDILDGRPCQDMERYTFRTVMMDVLKPIIEREIMWTFVPGNHDDDHSPWTREDLIEIYSLPFCVSAKAKTFNHTFTLGHTAEPCADSSVRIWLFDSGANSDDPKLRYTTFSAESIEGYVRMSSDPSLGPSAVGLAYFHIPLPEYEGVVPCCGKNALFDAGLAGGLVPFPFNYQPFTFLVRLLGRDLVAGCSRLNSGAFEAFSKQGNILATFCGHDHHSDFVGKRGNIYLCYGRCGGFTPPSNWEGAGGDFAFDHGARVVRVRSKEDVSTWVCTFKRDVEDFFELK